MGEPEIDDAGNQGNMSSRSPRIAVLLATYNGEAFLEQQMASLVNQDWPLIDMWVSDDGSTDATLAILRKWRSTWTKGAFHILDGPRRGFSENFRSLMANPNLSADAYAFCDQDDVWDADKLNVAMRALAEKARSRPGLYCSRTRLVDENGQQLGASPLFRRAPEFRNALIQSIGGGNTMLANRRAFEALTESARRTSFVSHDWWAYIIVSGIGGVVIYDPYPRIAYRQHRGNLVGNNAGMGARLRRIKGLFTGQLSRWNAANLASLARCEDMLTEECRRTTDAFRAARKSSMPMRLYYLLRSGVHRQRLLQDFAFWLAAAGGRI